MATIHDLTTRPADYDDSTLLAHLAADSRPAVLFSVPDYDEPDMLATYALIRADRTLATESDTTVAAGQPVVYYADSATNVHFDVADFADFIPAAAYDLI